MFHIALLVLAALATLHIALLVLAASMTLAAAKCAPTLAHTPWCMCQSWGRCWWQLLVLAALVTFHLALLVLATLTTIQMALLWRWCD